jgi:hypothetical protein
MIEVGSSSRANGESQPISVASGGYLQNFWSRRFQLKAA